MRLRIVKAATAATWLVFCAGRAIAGGIEVPVDGKLTTDNASPHPGDIIHVRLDVTALKQADTLTLAFKLPAGVVFTAGATTQQVFKAVAEGQTVTLATELKITSAGEKQLGGAVILVDTPTLRLAKGFLLTLNSEPKPLPKVQYGTNQQGQALIIYESGK